MPTKIFVGNLSSETTGEDLRPYFEQYGEVTECDVLRNFGFVHMAIEKEAEQAINELSGTVIHGQRINVEKSTGSSRGGGRGGGGGKMLSSRGGRGRGAPRGAPRGRGAPPGRGERDPYDPYLTPPRSHPYSRDPYPYDYYDRHYPPDRLPPPPRHPDERRSLYDREERLPPSRDPYDRYLPPRYPPRSDPYAAYDRYPPPRSADPYERPPPDYYSRYRTYDGYDDPPRRPGESAAPPPPATRAANGYEERRPEPPPPAGGESFSSTYTSYYDRFYSKASSNGAAASPQRPLMAQSGVRAAAAGRGAPSLVRNDQQAALQTGPIYF